MTEFLQLVVFGVVLGGIIALGAIGVSLIFGILRFANFAHGDTMAFGAMVTILMTWWLQQTARWQAVFVRRASDMIRRVLNVTPEWSHPFLLVGVGVAQPFLPAALVDDAALIWRGIAIWRAVGWTLLLPLLIVAPLVAIARLTSGFSMCLLRGPWQLSQSPSSGGLAPKARECGVAAYLFMASS